MNRRNLGKLLMGALPAIFLGRGAKAESSEDNAEKNRALWEIERSMYCRGREMGQRPVYESHFPVQDAVSENVYVVLLPNSNVAFLYKTTSPSLEEAKKFVESPCGLLGYEKDSKKRVYELYLLRSPLLSRT